MSERLRCLLTLCVMMLLAGCGGKGPSPQTVTMLIESSPTSLDPRIGVDAQSEHIGSLIFDSLVRKNEHFNLEPWLATSWETPDPLNLSLSPAHRRAFSKRAAADLRGCEIHPRFHAQRHGDHRQGGSVGAYRSRRRARCGNGRHPFETAGCRSAVEPFRRRDRHCSRGQRP